MKRTAVSMLFLALIFSLTACNYKTSESTELKLENSELKATYEELKSENAELDNDVQLPAESFPEVLTVSSEQTSQWLYQEDLTSLAYVSEAGEFTLHFPESWRGEYLIYENGEDAVVYLREAVEKNPDLLDFGTMIFSIISVDKSNIEEYKYLNEVSTYYGESDTKIYYWNIYDIPFSVLETVQDYRELLDTIEVDIYNIFQIGSDLNSGMPAQWEYIYPESNVFEAEEFGFKLNFPELFNENYIVRKTIKEGIGYYTFHIKDNDDPDLRGDRVFCVAAVPKDTALPNGFSARFWEDPWEGANYSIYWNDVRYGEGISREDGGIYSEIYKYFQFSFADISDIIEPI